MKYHVIIAGEAHEVVLAADGSGWRVSLAGQDHHVDVGVVDDGHAYSLLIDDRSIDVGVESDGTSIDLVIAGRRYTTEVLGEREWLARTIKGEAAEGDKTVRAVMTGIMREVLVAPGDAVSRGQTLFILEAMKMENEVKSEVDGVVRAVQSSAGQTVSIGDVVVEID